MNPTCRYIIVRREDDPNAIVAVASVPDRGGPSRLPWERPVKRLRGDVEPGRAYVVGCSTEPDAAYAPDLLALAPAISAADVDPLRRRRRDLLLGAAMPDLGEFGRVSIGTPVPSKDEAPALRRPSRRVDPLYARSCPSRWIVAFPRHCRTREDLEHAVSHTWRGLRPDLIRYDADSWVDARTGIDGLMPIVGFAVREAEAADIGDLLALGPEEGVSAPFDYLDMRSTEAVVADMPILATELMSLESAGRDAGEAIRRALETGRDFDPRLAARLRSAATVAEDSGLAGRLLDWTLERAGWKEIERRTVRKAETRLLDQVERRAGESLAEIEAAHEALVRTLSKVEEYSANREPEPMSEMLAEIEARLSSLASGMAEMIEARLAEVELSRDASREALLADLRREWEATADTSRGAAAERPLDGRGLVGEAKTIEDPADRATALNEAATAGNLDIPPMFAIATLSLSGYLPIVSSRVGPNFGAVLATVAGGGHLFRIDCDPTLVTPDDVRGRLKRTGVLEIEDDACAALLVSNLNLSPAVYWLDAFLGEVVEARRGRLIVLATAADHPFRHGLARHQLERVVPLEAGIADGPSSDRPVEPRRFPAIVTNASSPGDIGGHLDSIADDMELPHLRALARIRRVAVAAFGNPDLVGPELAKRLAAWWQGVQTGRPPADGVGALLVKDGDWT